MSFIYPKKGLRFDTKEDTKDLISLLLENKTSQIVDISGNTISIEASEEIARALEQFENIEELNCSDFFTTRLKTDVPISISNIAKAIQNHKNLKHVDFSDNALGEPGVRSILENLLDKKNFTTLTVTNCGLGPKGALTFTQLVRGLVQAPLLTDSQIPSEVAEELNIEPAEHVDHNEALNLSLNRLLVGRNRFKEPGAYILAKGIEYLPNLLQLEVNGNSITPAGIEAIINSLQYCPKIEILNFYDNTFKKKGVKALIKLLPKLHNLKFLNLEDCTLEEDGVKDVILVLSENNPNLEYLNLGYDEIDNSTAELLITCIKKKANLKKLDINGNAISKKQIATIKKILKERDAEIGSLSDNEDEDEEEEEEEEGDESGDEKEVEKLISGVKLSE